MEEKQFRPVVRAVMEQCGFVVTDIPTDPFKKTPDFLLQHGQEKTLLELKIKGDDPNEVAADKAMLDAGLIATRCIPIRPRNRLYAIVEDGTKQMVDYDASKNAFRVIWIHCDGRNAYASYERTHFTLYGKQHLYSADRPHNVYAYYFHPSSFWTLRDSLDAVIVSYAIEQGLQLQLCVNSVGTRKDHFRQSLFHQSFEDGLCDPDVLEPNEHTFIVDSAMDRKAKDPILDFLRNKYKVEHLQIGGMGAYSAMIQVPKDAL
jgi:hypothetical protein